MRIDLVSAAHFWTGGGVGSRRSVAGNREKISGTGGRFVLVRVVLLFLVVLLFVFVFVFVFWLVLVLVLVLSFIFVFLRALILLIPSLANESC